MGQLFLESRDAFLQQVPHEESRAVRFCCLRVEAGTIGRPEHRECQVPNLNASWVNPSLLHGLV